VNSSNAAPNSGSGGANSRDAANTTNVFVDRLADPPTGCLPRSLMVDDAGRVPCTIIEAVPTTCTCDAARGRASVSDVMDAAVRGHLELTSDCGGTTGVDCSDFCLCAIIQLEGSALTACQNDSTATDPPGFCYIDPSQNAGAAELVSDCPETTKRRFRFLGSDTPATDALTFIACAGAAVP
jgi:hypothetical protein